MTTPAPNELFFAAALIIALTASGFNRPSWSRTYTTFARYYLSLALYVEYHVAILLASYVFTLPIREAFDWPLWVSVWSAFAITITVHIAPVFAGPMRHRIQRLAGIPGKANDLSAILADAELHASGEVQARANATLRTLGIGPGSDWLPKARRLHEHMNRATCLFVQLREWENQPRLAGFIEEAKNEIFRLRQRFDAMSLRVSRMLASIELLGQIKHEFTRKSLENDCINDHFRRLIEDMIADACEDVSLFHRDACLLATRGILTIETTRIGRRRAFTNLGFRQNELEHPSLYFVFPLAAGFLFVGLWVFFLLFPVEKKDLEPLQLQILIMSIQMGAIAISILPKTLYGFANGGLHKRTPWLFVIASGIFAVLFAILVNILVGAAIHHESHGLLGGASRRLVSGAPFLPFAMLTATSVAWLIQDHRWHRIDSRVLRRGCDAIVFGLAWVSAGIFALVLEGLADGLILPDAAQALSTQKLTGMFLFGGSLGALISEYVRKPRNVDSKADTLEIPAWLGTTRFNARERTPRSTSQYPS